MSFFDKISIQRIYIPVKETAAINFALILSALRRHQLYDGFHTTN